jgi:predicted DNA-binding transcriptional regulator YafY
MDQDLKKAVTINYTNWQEETEDRHIIPLELFFGKTEWHPEEQWLLRALDLDKNAERSFALKDIHTWTPGVTKA